MTQYIRPRVGARRLTRRSVLSLFAGVGATGLLAACGGGSQTNTKTNTLSTQVPPATTPQAPAVNQTLTGTATPATKPASSPSPSPAAQVERAKVSPP